MMLTESVGKEKDNTKKVMDRQITKLLLIITTVFIVLNFPFTFYAFLPLASAPRWKKVIYEGGLVGVYLNVSVNFYLYCLGYKKFRRDVNRLFCLRKFRRKDQ